MHSGFQYIFIFVFGLIFQQTAIAENLLFSSAASEISSSSDQTIYIEAERVQGKMNQRIEAEGKVELRQSNQKVSADKVIYEQKTGDLSANGEVKYEQPSGIVSGPDLTLNLDNDTGLMNKPAFKFNDNNARGYAESMSRLDKQDYEFRDAVYTTCPAEADDWLLKMARLEIDRKTQTGTAHSAWIEFQGIPLLYTPWMSFPLDGRRQSGFLGPTFGVTTTGGAEITFPFYWNITPTYDATISPRIINNRGVMLNDEFRYLGADYFGEIHYDVLQNDRIANLTRTHTAFNHEQSFGNNLSAMLNLNHVSDDAYFRDLSTTVISGTQTQLPNEGALLYAGGWWSAEVKAQIFQTLQDPLSPIAIPYYRLPQVNLSAQKSIENTQVKMVNEYVNFRHPDLVNGQRLVMYPSITYAVINDPGFYLKPKLGVHHTQYVMGENNITNIPDSSRTLPIFSLDSGMTFERNFSLANNEYVQTLEPRAYYVKIPYLYQNYLPNYDASQAVFSFAQMFTENRFFGNDRIGDANMMTVAFTSRLIDNAGGAERLRVAIGERFSFEPPQVNLLTPDANSRSDILLAAAGRVSSTLSLDSLLQYNPNTMNVQSSYFTVNYKPEIGKVLNLGYRYTRGDIPANDVRQIDFSSQWPLMWRWYGVSRLSYSLQDSRILEALAGLEYNQSCWMLRLVAQQFPTATQQVSTGIFMQLELNDLVALGADPLSALRSSIPGYSKLNASSTANTAQGLH